MSTPEDTIARIRRNNQMKASQDLDKQRHQEQTNSNAHMQRAIFESFQALVGALNGDQTKAEALSRIFKTLEDLGGKAKNTDTDLALLKSGLTTLEKELRAIPADDLKQLPKFLQQREKIKVTNLDELQEGFTKVVEAIHSMNLSVEAPVVNIDAPVVNVPETVVNVPEFDIKPLKDAMLGVVEAIKSTQMKLDNGALKTRAVNTLVHETFDEYRLHYDAFDDESEHPRIEAISYYLAGKTVARVTYAYNKAGQLIGGKRAKATK